MLAVAGRLRYGVCTGFPVRGSLVQNLSSLGAPQLGLCQPPISFSIFLLACPSRSTSAIPQFPGIVGAYKIASPLRALFLGLGCSLSLVP